MAPLGQQKLPLDMRSTVLLKRLKFLKIWVGQLLVHGGSAALECPLSKAVSAANEGETVDGRESAEQVTGTRYDQ